MTIQELLDRVGKSPEVVLSWTEAELQEHLSPLLPKSRAPYVGPKTDSIRLKDNRQLKISHIQNKLNQLNAILGIDPNKTL